MPDSTSYPSPFYSLFEGAARYDLCFSCDEDFGGPHLLENGEVDAERNKEHSEEPIMAVPLGNDRYRLAERMAGPLSGLTMDWGDEFDAECTGDRLLVFKRLVLPRRFVHWHLIGQSGFSNASDFAELLHRNGGGWESIAGGLLTFTVPAEHAGDLHAEADRADILPKGLALR